MPEQPSTLAARIRAKYPGVYDDIADGELEQRVTAKFPGAYDDIPRTEATLTRERRAPDAPSAMEAGHHPESARTIFGKPVPGMHDLGPGDLPSDAAFMKRAPALGGMAGMIAAGPLGAGAGAAAGSLVRDQFDRGAHVPTRGELGGAALEGGKTVALSAVPGLSRVAAERIGPALVNNASGISKGVSALSGIGAGVASGNPLTGIGAGAATKMLTSPSGIRAAGRLATRVGDAPMHAVNKTGFGLLTADAVRQALLEAMGGDEQP